MKRRVKNEWWVSFIGSGDFRSSGCRGQSRAVISSYARSTMPAHAYSDSVLRISRRLRKRSHGSSKNGDFESKARQLEIKLYLFIQVVTWPGTRHSLCAFSTGSESASFQDILRQLSKQATSPEQGLASWCEHQRYWLINAYVFPPVFFLLELLV